jgi:sulfur-oxidizing protein SoxX
MARRCAAALVLFASVAPAFPAALLPYEIAGEAIPTPLGGLKGDAERGRAIVVDRQKGLCLLCHTGPFPEQRFQGDIAPSLAGAGSRLSEGQLRLRLVDGARVNPRTVMPSYYRIDHLTRVAPAFRGRPILDAQDVEDVVAFLATLRDKPLSKEMR